jgi:crotonobetainyl-CoA:carnitine CoA-transferase CaiB-like acyl-CoA transferase
MMGAFFLTCNRNKRSVVLDLKQPDAQQALAKIVAGADAVITSVRPSSAARQGMSYEELSAVRPDLVYVQGSGYNQRSSRAGDPAYDDVIQAASGLAGQLKVITGKPRYVPAVIADKVCGLHVAISALAALTHRQITGRGQLVQVPMSETMAAFNLTEHMWGQVFEPPESEMGYPPVATSSRHPYATKDGFISILPYTNENWRRFLEIAGEPELFNDDRLNNFRGRQQNFQFSWDTAESLLTRKTSAEWLAALRAADVPCAPINSLADLTTDPYLEEVGFWTEMRDGSGESLRAPRSTLEFAESPSGIRYGPPMLGQHTRDVLEEAGVTSADIDRLAADADCGAFGEGQ